MVFSVGSLRKGTGARCQTKAWSVRSCHINGTLFFVWNKSTSLRFVLSKLGDESGRHGSFSLSLSTFLSLSASPTRGPKDSSEFWIGYYEECYFIVFCAMALSSLGILGSQIGSTLGRAMDGMKEERAPSTTECHWCMSSPSMSGMSLTSGWRVRTFERFLYWVVPAVD